MVEFGHKLYEKMKAMLRETKENVQGTNRDAKETGTQSTVWTRRKKETSNQKRMKKQEFRKMRGLGTSGTTLTFQHPNYRGTRRRRGRTKN